MSAGFCSVAYGQKCIEYDRDVTLSGILRSQTFPGPPNYESIKRGDQKERAIIIRLGAPICTRGGSDIFNVAENNIRDVQLVLNETSHWKVVERRIKKRVTVRGSIFHSHTGHHKTKVLLEVTQITPS